MARHNRKPRPRDRSERARTEQRESRLLAQLTRQAEETQELKAIADRARLKMRRRAVELIKARELDITDIAQATGISRDTLHRLIRERRKSDGTSGWTPIGASVSFAVGSDDGAVAGSPETAADGRELAEIELTSRTIPEPRPAYRAGEQVLHPSLGEGVIEHVDGPVLSIRFARQPRDVIQLHTGLATALTVVRGPISTGSA
jgi:DNA-binding transcriptional ArsR family regulator